jgi:hypothetical protein
MASTRRFAAILAADVAGYSRLMGADEEGTLSAEAARPTEHPDVLEYILRARAAWNNRPARDNYVRVIQTREKRRP